MNTSQGFYRFRIGTINATAILDGALSVPVALYGVNVAPEEVAAFLGTYNLPPTLALVPNTTLLLDTGQARILVDTGLGHYALPGLEGNAGKLRDTLHSLGVEPDSIDIVFLTHAHPDHIGALVDEAGKPTFRNARHLLHQRDWDFWTGPAPADPNAAFFFQVAAEQLAPLADRIERFTGEIEVVPGIRTVEAFGETPGHTGLLIESGDERMFHMGDAAAHSIISFGQPDWITGVWAAPEQALETRKRLLDWLARERIKTFAPHHPFPGLGVAARDRQGVGWVWTPVG
ncbi:MAG: MBL fold metallo-hydrolase [Roseiflexaceae bacterium]|nr:MBL fold metallo-hydrolase [Roseiflexaceae bacterium]